jgi:hypothetical protein
MASSPSPSPTLGAPHRLRRLALPGALAVALVVAVAVVGWLVLEITAPARSLRALPPAERRQVYERTLDDLRTLCGPDRAAALRNHCRQLAELIAPLEECGPECEAVIRPILTPVPTR